MESDRSPPVTGFVIITLPPPDNPSYGKTITAFTISDSDSPTDQLPHRSPPSQLPIPPPPNPERQFPIRRSLSRNPRAVLGLLGISLAALILWASASPTTLYELGNSNDGNEDDDQNRKPTSFVLPLYPKYGSDSGKIHGEIELKLGKFVRKNSEKFGEKFDDGVISNKKHKLVSSTSTVESTTISPLRGNIYPDGLYFTSMLVGSPPKPYFLDIDTGSDLTWIQCDAPCQSCSKGPHPLYKPTKGKIIPYKDQLCVEVQRNQKDGHCEACHQCDYEIEYADESSSIGVLARDELHLTMANGSLSESSVVFGCGYDQQGLLLNSMAMTDGILGLSRAKVSLPSQLASQGIINNVVGHCLTNDGGGGGYMFLGDDFVPYWQMSWVPMLNNPTTNFYEAEVSKMSYGDQKLSLSGQHGGIARVVFDSGSSYTYFTKQAYSDLITSLADVSGEALTQDPSDTTLPICWRAKFPLRSVSDVKQYFKPLTIQFGSKWWMVSRKLRIQPEGYLVISNQGNVCLGILDGSNVHDGSAVLLGDISMRGELVVYDNVNQKIGWSASDCVKPPRIRSLPITEGMDLQS